MKINITREQFINSLTQDFEWKIEYSGVIKLIKGNDSIIIEKNYFTLNNFGRLHHYKYCRDNLKNVIRLYHDSSLMIEYNLKDGISSLRDKCA